MKKKNKRLTRRDFLRGAAGAVLAGTAGSNIFCTSEPQEGRKPPAPEVVQTVEGRSERSRVVLIRDENVLYADGRPDPVILTRMLDDGVKRLLNEPSADTAWSRLVKPSDTVGIKSNVWRFLRTPPALEKAIQKNLIGAGVSENRISTSDRRVLKDPVFKKATALINVRPLRTHHWSGVGSLIKNYIMFSPRPASWHGDSCADLAGLWDLPEVKGKTRLNILVMLTPLFHGKGPHHFQSKYTWKYKGLLTGIDPVAVDAVGVRILEAKRREYFGEDQPFTVSPKHIEVADKKFGLGTADPDKIDLIKLGSKDGIFI